MDQKVERIINIFRGKRQAEKSIPEAEEVPEFNKSVYPFENAQAQPTGLRQSEPIPVRGVGEFVFIATPQLDSGMTLSTIGFESPRLIRVELTPYPQGKQAYIEANLPDESPQVSMGEPEDDDRPNSKVIFEYWLPRSGLKVPSDSTPEEIKEAIDAIPEDILRPKTSNPLIVNRDEVPSLKFEIKNLEEVVGELKTSNG